MVIDFPKNELKPLNMILKSVEEGFYDCFGVKYIILEAGKNHFKDKDEVWTLYEKFYRSFLPADKFNKNIMRLY